MPQYPFRALTSYAAIAGLLTAVAAAPVIAQRGLDQLDSSVSSVVTGGYWETNGQHGYIRLVVLTSGSEHLISTLYVQWLEDARETEPARVVRSQRVEGVPSGLWTLGAPRFSLVQKKWQATIDGTDSHTSPMKRGRWLLVFGEPGELSVRVAAP